MKILIPEKTLEGDIKIVFTYLSLYIRKNVACIFYLKILEC